MRKGLLAYGIATILFAACSSTVETSGSGGGTTSTSSSTTTSTATTTTASSTGGPMICQAGSMQACTCANGKTGMQTCNPVGTSWLPCECDQGGTAGGGGGGGCAPGQQVPCYTGPAGTLGVGVCKTGQAQCQSDGVTLGPCLGQVLPHLEVCTTTADDDCNGSAAPCTDVPSWGGSFGNGKNLPLGLAVDAFGDAIVAMQSNGTDFGTGPIDGVGLVTFDPLGKVADARALAADLGWTSLALAPNGDRVVASGNANAITVDRFDAAGNTVWSRSYPSTGNHVSYAVGADAAGAVIIAGGFGGTIDFGNGAMVAPTSNQDTFVAKLAPDGGLLWAKQTQSPGGTFIKTITADDAGNAILVGTMSGSADFGAGEVQSAGGFDVIVVKLDPAGKPLWVRRFGDGVDQPEARGAVDAAGNVLLTGSSNGTIDFGGGALGPGIFVAKLDPSGNHLWGHSFSGTGVQLPGTIAAVGGGGAIVVGGFSGSIGFGGNTLVSAGQEDVFVTRFDPSGAIVSARRFGDAGSQIAQFVALDPAGVPVVVGYYNGTLDFGQGQPLTAGGTYDTFVARVSP